MTLEAFYFIAQIFAAVAIVSSLIFVGMQIKASTREQRQLRIQDRSSIILAFLQMFTTEPRNRTVFIQGLDSFKSLSPEDRLLFDSIMAALARSVLLYHRQYLDGDLEEQSWDTYLQHVKPMMGAPGTHEWIEARGHHVFGSSFVTVESFVGSSDGREAYKHWRAGFVEDA